MGELKKHGGMLTIKSYARVMVFCEVVAWASAHNEIKSSTFVYKLSHDFSCQICNYEIPLKTKPTVGMIIIVM
jgi:hypothetical protein